jgi:beta-galactosidase/beta-glucuronidase
MFHAACYKKGYPRPQFVRSHWQNLDGEWDFAFDDKKEGFAKKFYHKIPSPRKILVPYSYETPKSGIGDTGKHEWVWYSRRFVLPMIAADKRTLINFEGADFRTLVYVNGILAGSHIGGYCRFSFDITDLLKKGENTVTVCCMDSADTAQPRGKQHWVEDNSLCWYVQTTGIWKSVWLEFVNSFHLDHVKITPCFDTSSVRFDYAVSGAEGAKGFDRALCCRVSFRGEMIAEVSQKIFRTEGTVTVLLKSDSAIWKIHKWDIWKPELYDAEFILTANGKEVDFVGSYFGLRKIETAKDGVRINNGPLYQKLVLAQNYWPDSGLTMPDEEAAARDLDAVVAAGFNGVRIHQKIEDERFLYVCDIRGILVWSEFPSGYEFNDRAIGLFTTEWQESLKQMYNHPSIIAWVPFNESWGISEIYSDAAQQQFTRGIYGLTKAYDPYRPVICNDGWEHTCSDIITLHDYVGDADNMQNRYGDLTDILSNSVSFNLYRYAFSKGWRYEGQPVMISEYGGITLSGSNGWGYNGAVKDETDYIAKFGALTTAIKNMANVCGYCYTQLTDVYQEVNGYLTPEREPKVDLNKLKEINDR